MHSLGSHFGATINFTVFVIKLPFFHRKLFSVFYSETPLSYSDSRRTNIRAKECIFPCLIGNTLKIEIFLQILVPYSDKPRNWSRINTTVSYIDIRTLKSGRFSLIFILLISLSSTFYTISRHKLFFFCWMFNSC